MFLQRIERGTGIAGFVQSARFEAAVLVVFGMVLPLLLIDTISKGIGATELGIGSFNPRSAPVINSVVGAATCILTSVFVLRRFARYPGAPLARAILPVMASAYGLLLAVLLMVRLPYSSQVLMTCFAFGTLARYGMEAVHERVRKRVFYLVPGGEVGMATDLKRTTTVSLECPETVLAPGQAIIADLHADLSPDWERFIAEQAIRGTPVYHYKQVWEAETGCVQIDHLSENSLGALVPNFAYRTLKRAMDVAGAMLLLPLLLPFFAVMAVAIRLDSPGPVFFRQQRMGYRGEIFSMTKFRTMTVLNDGSERDASVTVDDDQRITRVGRWLRRSRLDELPQLFNVLKGEMSLIGPRPEAISLSDWYENEIGFYRYRHIVRPGITGWAQVNQGHVASIDEVNRKLQFDFYYIKNLSFWLDTIIAVRTLRVILFGLGAK